ncbi:MAG: CAP domain-containing protein, partial [Bdellovibrionales bacterium]
VTPTSPAAPAAETSTAPHESAPPPVAESTPAFQPPPMDDDFQLDVATAERIPLPRARPRPQPVAAPVAPAVAEMNPLEKELLNSINRSRAQAGVAPLKFSRLQSSGSSKCLGSEGHSVHMGQTRKMSHDQFPQDICVRTSASGENVGYASGAQVQAVRTVHKMMMDEGPGGGHYQNIMSSHYNTLGVGFYYSNNVLWVTESFLRL